MHVVGARVKRLRAIGLKKLKSAQSSTPLPFTTRSPLALTRGVDGALVGVADSERLIKETAMRPSTRNLSLLASAAATALALIAPAHAAGAVKVSFVQPERFTDAGYFGRDRADNLDALARYLQTLAARQLADGQTLDIQVLDVDLAGRMKPIGPRGDVRVLNGRVDWPRIKLHYSLEAGGQVLRSGDDSLADLNYLQHVPGRYDGDALHYEKVMLDAWFKARFAPAAAP